MSDAANPRLTRPFSGTQLQLRRTFILTSLFALFFVSLSGCTSIRTWKQNGFKVGPDYQKPAAPVEVEWIDLKRDSRVSADEPELAAWWQSLNDPVLNDLIYQAYGQNLTLRQAGTTIMRARAIRGAAAGSLFPQFQEASGSYARVQTSLNTAIPSPLRTFDDWATGVNAAWELDFWGRFRRSLSAADAELDASVENYDDVLVILIADVASAYVQIRAVQKRLEIVRENLESQRGSLKIAEALFLGQAKNKLAVNQSRNNIAITEAAIPLLENQLRINNNRLCVLLGIPPRDLVSEWPPMPIPNVSPEIRVGIPADILRRRPDVRAAERAMAAQSERIGIAEADLYPRISLSGAIEWQAGSMTQLFEPDSVFALVSPGFSWKVLNYGRIRNSISAQQALFETRVYQYQEKVLTAQKEVENSINTFINTQDRQEKLQTAVDEILEAQNIAVTLYETGATNFNTVFLIEIFRLAQQEQLIINQQDIVLSAINVYRALGGGWQIRCQQQTPALEGSPSIEPQPAQPQLAPPADNAALQRQLASIVERLGSIENELVNARTQDVDVKRQVGDGERVANFANLPPQSSTSSKTSQPATSSNENELDHNSALLENWLRRNPARSRK